MEKIVKLKYGEPCPNNIPMGYPRKHGNYEAGAIACEYCPWCRGFNFDKEEMKCCVAA